MTRTPTHRSHWTLLLLLLLLLLHGYWHDLNARLLGLCALIHRHRALLLLRLIIHRGGRGRCGCGAPGRPSPIRDGARRPKSPGHCACASLFFTRSASDSTTTAEIVSRLVKLLPDASIIQFDGKLTSLSNFSAVSSECEEENVEKRKEKEKYPNMRKTAWAGYQNKKEEKLH